LCRSRRRVGLRNKPDQYSAADVCCFFMMGAIIVITPLAADNKIHTIHIKYIKTDKKSYKVTVPAKTLHTASLTYTQLFVNKSIPYLQPMITALNE